MPITHYSASEGDRSLLSDSDKSITFSLKTSHVQRLSGRLISLVRLSAHQPHQRHWPQPHCLISLNDLFGSSANQLCQPHWLIDSSAVLRMSHRSCNRSNKNNMAAQASSSTRSCHLAIKRYQNCSLNLLFHRLITSHAFAREGKDVVVAHSCEEKDVAVDCLFWQILQR